LNRTSESHVDDCCQQCCINDSPDDSSKRARAATVQNFNPAKGSQFDFKERYRGDTYLRCKIITKIRGYLTNWLNIDR
jgi:hypothetical protein